jgi:hypothetical protein
LQHKMRKHKIRHNFIHLFSRTGGTTDSFVITGYAAERNLCVFLGSIVTA